MGDVFVRDPIHGMIRLKASEVALIKHEAFQRLNRIRQLAMTYKVYPGATHTRWEHSLGVMHIASQMMERLYRRNLENYLALDDSTVLEAIKSKRKDNEWARRIYERDHLSEAFVTSPHHAGLESYFVISELEKLFKKKYPDGFVDNKARTLPTNPLFDLKKFEDDEAEASERRYASITVQDKNNPDQYETIFELSLPLKLLSRKHINIVRFYVPREYKKDAAAWCHQHYNQIRSKVNKIEEGWS